MRRKCPKKKDAEIALARMNRQTTKKFDTGICGISAAINIYFYNKIGKFDNYCILQFMNKNYFYNFNLIVAFYTNFLLVTYMNL